MPPSGHPLCAVLHISDACSQNCCLYEVMEKSCVSVVNGVNESIAQELVKFSVRRKDVWQECQALWERPAGFHSGGTDALSLLQCSVELMS